MDRGLTAPFAGCYRHAIATLSNHDLPMGKGVRTLSCVLAVVLTTCNADDAIEKACTPDDLEDLQESCLSYGGSFIGESTATGLTDCGGSGSGSAGGAAAAGQCVLEGSGSCSAICDLGDGGGGGDSDDTADDTGSTDDEPGDSDFALSVPCGEDGWLDVDIDDNYGSSLVCGVCGDGRLGCFDNDGSPLEVPVGNTFEGVRVSAYSPDTEAPFACALHVNGSATCWQWVLYEYEPELLDLGSEMSGKSLIEVANTHLDQAACALTPAGEVECEGDGVDWPGGAQAQMTMAQMSACFLGVDGYAQCTGWLEDDCLDDEEASVVEVIDLDVVGEPASPYTNEAGCVLKADGTVACFYNSAGTNFELNTLEDEVTGLIRFAIVSDGICGIDAGGAIVCWGEMTGGAPTGIYVDIVSGYMSGFCAIRDDAALRCWDEFDAP